MYKYILLFLFIFPLAIKVAQPVTPSVTATDTSTVSLTDEEQTAEDALNDDDDDDSTLYSNQHYLLEPLKKDSFNRADWNKAKKGLDYTEHQPKKIETKTEEYTPSTRGSFFSGTAFKFIFAGLVIGVLVFLLWKIFADRLGNRTFDNEQMLISVEDIEDITKVSESELERLLREAIEKEDYKEAVRIYYVSILLGLSERNMITWRKEKTNREYLMELSALAQYPVFRDLTLLFERIWYGDIELAETDYVRVEPLFKSFTDSIKLNKPFEK